MLSMRRPFKEEEMEKEKPLAGVGATAGGMLPIYNQHVIRRNINPSSAVTAGLLHAARSEPGGRMESPRPGWRVFAR